MRRRSSGAAPAGPAASATRSSRAAQPQSDWEGLAASIRGALSWGMSGAPLPRAATSAAATARRRRRSSGCAGCRPACSRSHLRLPGGDERLPWALRRRGRGDRAEVARVPLPAAALPAARDRRRRRATGLPVMRAMPLAFPGNALAARLRDAVHVRRRAAGRADRRPRAAKSRSRCRRARGTTSIRASAFRACACCATGPRSTSSRSSAAKATRCRSAPPSSTPARSTAARPLDALWVFGRADADARRLRAGRRSAPAPTARWSIDAAPELAVELLRRRRELAASSRAASSPRIGRTAMSAPRARSRSPSASPPASAPSSSPCWPRRHRERPFAARLVVVGDRDAARRARRAHRLAPRAMPRYDPAAPAPRGRRRRSLAPAAAPCR